MTAFGSMLWRHRTDAFGGNDGTPAMINGAVVGRFRCDGERPVRRLPLPMPVAS